MLGSLAFSHLFAGEGISRLPIPMPITCQVFVFGLEIDCLLMLGALAFSHLLMQVALTSLYYQYMYAYCTGKGNREERRKEM
jgi:hypothetical protein